MEFLTPGERVKKIRKMLKMKQRELQDENVTRGFISMIESGRSTMSKETASIIADKFNKRAQELGIDLNIDGDYLLMTPAEEAEYYCIQKLNEIKNIEDLNNMKEIFEIADKYKRKRVNAKAYIKMGDVIYNSHNYQDAFTNYYKALEILLIYNIKEQLPYVYNMLGACKVNLSELSEAIIYFDKAIEYASETNEIDVKNKAVYNNALCYRRIGKTTIAIDYINKYLSTCDKNKDFDHYIYANSTKANCYRDEGDYQKALGLFKNLLREINNDEHPLIGFLCTNIGEIYMEQSNFEESLKYFDKAEKIRREKDKDLLAHTLIEKANVYIKMKLNDKALSLLEEGLEISYKNNDIEYILKGNYGLIEVYKQLKDKEKIINIYKKIINVLKDIDNEKELLKVYTKLSLLYLEDDDITNCSYCLKKMEDIIK